MTPTPTPDQMLALYAVRILLAAQFVGFLCVMYRNWPRSRYGEEGERDA